MLFLGVMGNGLFGFGDESSDEDGAGLCCRKTTVMVVLFFGCSSVSAAVNGKHGCSQQGEVAYGVEGVAGDVDAAVKCKVWTLSPLDDEATWVVTDIGYHVLQLFVAAEDTVVVALGKET